MKWLMLVVLALVPTAVLAQQAAQPKKEETKAEEPTKEGAPKQAEEAQAKPEDDQKVRDSKALGMSVLGNQEAPKALVIVPWKTSELGTGPNVSTILDDSRSPIDKEVFMRMLSYYEVRSGTAAPADAAQRRKP